MFQVTIGSLGLIAFVWGPLANGGIRMGSEQTDPRKAHQTTIFSWKGFRMNPSNLSESVSCCFQLA